VSFVPYQALLVSLCPEALWCTLGIAIGASPGEIKKLRWRKHEEMSMWFRVDQVPRPPIGSIGTMALTMVPLPSALSTKSLPPNARARASMLRKPCPS
jgi:hypothetical protein